jgi:hypothetical protein
LPDPQDEKLIAVLAKYNLPNCQGDLRNEKMDDFHLLLLPKELLDYQELLQ